MPHLDEGQLHALLDGELTPTERAEAEAHLASCAACRATQAEAVEFLAEAQASGFRTYLYYVATSSPEINIERVKYRVAMGGHGVPEAKIISRYRRSLELLFEAVVHTDRAYIFDNSGETKTWIAEVNEGRELTMQANWMPAWFKSALWDKFEEEP